LRSRHPWRSVAIASRNRDTPAIHGGAFADSGGDVGGHRAVERDGDDAEQLALLGRGYGVGGNRR
jgi:hypothetical protein